MSSPIRHISTTSFFFLSVLLVMTGCMQQEYDYKENHPLYVEHNHEHNHTEHNHSHDHTHQNDDGNPNFSNLVDELEDNERVIWQKPDKVIEILGDLDGKTVADIGAGTGYFSFRLANEASRVIAIDVDDRLIQYMDSIKTRFPEALQEKLDTRLAEYDDPKLQMDEADVVILVNTYTYIDDRIDYFKKVADGMKSGGKLLIVDYKTKRLPDGQGPPIEFRLSADSVENELEMAGYRLMETDDTTLDYQYIVLVSKP